MNTKRSLRREFLGTLAQPPGLTGAQIRVLARLKRREGAVWPCR